MERKQTNKQVICTSFQKCKAIMIALYVNYQKYNISVLIESLYDEDLLIPRTSKMLQIVLDKV